MASDVCCHAEPSWSLQWVLISVSYESQRSCFKQLKLSYHRTDVSSGLVTQNRFPLVVKKSNSNRFRFWWEALHTLWNGQLSVWQSHPLESPCVWKVAFRKPAYNQMGTAWEEKAGCDWGSLSNSWKETVLKWTALGLPADYIIRMVWSSSRSRMSMYVPRATCWNC